MANKQFTKSRFRNSSALILTVVLTSLLAIVGVMFVLVSRLDKMATSGLTENKELNSAAETVIAKISQELALDVPHTDANGIVLSEYYDYPDPCNAWLACLEPYQSGSDYYWRQISNITGTGVAWTNLPAKIIDDYQPNIEEDYKADADGDGVSDSVWVKIPDMTSSKGKPIYAAVRIIDNGGMLNVNTDYLFNPNETNVKRIDGSSQMQINLAALSQRGVSNGSLETAANKLQLWRCGAMSTDIELYKQNVIWQYYGSNGAYTPFDIGDELVLRNRYILNNDQMTTRIENLWTNAFKGGLEVPLTSPSEINTHPIFWGHRVSYDFSDANIYDYQHLSTTYNMDRSINPRGSKMVNVNRADANSIYNAVRKVLPDGLAAQIAVNLIDYRDDNNDVTSFDPDPPGGQIYYGFERPCIYISEIAYRYEPTSPPKKAYAIELYKPYSEDVVSNGTWRININGTYIPISSWPQNKHFYVIRNQNPTVNFGVIDDSDTVIVDDPGIIFADKSNIWLERYVADTNNPYKGNDFKQVQMPGGFINGTHSYRRDINTHKCIKRLWSGSLLEATLGSTNSYTNPTELIQPHPVQAHPANKNFTNIGEIGMVLKWDSYGDLDANTEDYFRINLADADPNFQKIFNYLTVFDPNEPQYGGHPATETRVKGRININTAPWFVLAQLPWMQYQDSTPFERAKAISNYRDSTLHGFKNIGELMLVDKMRNLGSDNKDNLNTDTPKGPDLTNDTARDDFEERDLIFARISNLVTVRSDVFTAYILVRIGKDGPQKRVMAILDRSNVYSPSDKVRIVALHPVPDPR